MSIFQTSCKAAKSKLISDRLQRFLLENEVNHSKVPNVQKLRVSDIVEFAESHRDIRSYLPEFNTERYPSRQWVWDIGEFWKTNPLVSTLIHNEFHEFVEEKIQSQEDDFMVKRNTNFKALPSFISLIKDSNVLSSTIKYLNYHRMRWKVLSVNEK